MHIELPLLHFPFYSSAPAQWRKLSRFEKTSAMILAFGASHRGLLFLFSGATKRTFYLIKKKEPGESIKLKWVTSHWS